MALNQNAKTKLQRKKTMTIKIAAARLSFPSLFNMATFGGESTGKYEATFILDKREHAATIKELQAAIDKLSKEELKGKVPADKLCLKDGDETERLEFAGKYTIKASTKKRPLVINRDKYIVEKNGEVLHLPRKEFELLALLASRPGHVFERDTILEKVWGTDIVVGDRTIDVHVRKLREKIGEGMIKTIKGIGYKFVEHLG